MYFSHAKLVVREAVESPAVVPAIIVRVPVSQEQKQPKELCSFDSEKFQSYSLHWGIQGARKPTGTSCCSLFSSLEKTSDQVKLIPQPLQAVSPDLHCPDFSAHQLLLWRSNYKFRWIFSKLVYLQCLRRKDVLDKKIKQVSPLQGVVLSQWDRPFDMCLTLQCLFFFFFMKWTRCAHRACRST
jgi:hypothetical protein